ncbi:MAG: cytochrome c family protein [Pseudomonadota bacterium]
MDTMEITKFVGAFCGALLVFLLINFVSNELYDTHSEMLAYTIEVDTGDAAEDEPVEEVDVAALMAAADAANGEAVFRKCAACHKLDGTDGVGPHLDGVVGREAGAVSGFAYSDAMAAHGPWTVEALYAFLGDPKGVIPGTKMAFAGLRRDTERADVIAYLQSVTN